MLLGQEDDGSISGLTRADIEEWVMTTCRAQASRGGARWGLCEGHRRGRIGCRNGNQRMIYKGTSGSSEPGFPIYLPQMAPLYTREPLSARNSVRRTIVQLQRPSPQPTLTWNRPEPLLSGHFSDTAPHLCPFFASLRCTAVGHRCLLGLWSAGWPPDRLERDSAQFRVPTRTVARRRPT